MASSLAAAGGAAGPGLVPAARWPAPQTAPQAAAGGCTLRVTLGVSAVFCCWAALSAGQALAAAGGGTFSSSLAEGRGIATWVRW